MKYYHQKKENFENISQSIADRNHWLDKKNIF
jgi:hypothetical protein